mmetsp:Transcript_37581/g.115822  ORF Transcript_37581/g.115822 Transcript_37581/m.115822 type:complete len:208 (-) Transcript_37581:335-958(-)
MPAPGLHAEPASTATCGYKMNAPWKPPVTAFQLWAECCCGKGGSGRTRPPGDSRSFRQDWKYSLALLVPMDQAASPTSPCRGKSFAPQRCSRSAAGRAGHNRCKAELGSHFHLSPCFQSPQPELAQPPPLELPLEPDVEFPLSHQVGPPFQESVDQLVLAQLLPPSQAVGPATDLCTTGASLAAGGGAEACSAAATPAVAGATGWSV